MAIQYFTHDFNARSDPKLLNLRADLGMQGVGAYWCLIEILFEQNGFIHKAGINGIAYELHIEKSILDDILTKYDLFICENDKYFSNGVLKRLEKINTIKQRAVEKATKRWENEKKPAEKKSEILPLSYHSNATAMQIKLNKIKLNKIKLIKGKLYKEKINKKKNLVAFQAPVFCEVNEYWNELNEERILNSKPKVKFDPNEFIDHYTANGWKIGKNCQPMKDWKATVRNWIRTAEERLTDKIEARASPPEDLMRAAERLGVTK